MDSEHQRGFVKIVTRHLRMGRTRRNSDPRGAPEVETRVNLPRSTMSTV